MDWLHFTVQGVGFIGEVTPDDLARIVEAVRPRLAAGPAVALTFTRPVVFSESVVLVPEPAEPVHAIRIAIRAGIADVWGPERVPETDEGFRAHVSIGYVNRPGLASPIIRAVQRIRPEPATVTIRVASLIEL